ncbi:LysE family translocator [Inhella sp.]|uniref:LysE family translocator n=1 Tax=Inhella sp. TaxID=1921806 RepID=UPI0035B0D152
MPDLIPLMTYCFVMSSTPGPNNVMLTASGANFGYRGALPQILGIGVGGFVLTLLSCLGLGNLFMAWPLARELLRVVGALYLVYLAWKLSGAGGLQGAELPRPASFWQGFAFQAVNPKSWVKAITIGSVFLPSGLSPAEGGLLAASLGLLIGLPCTSSWALFGVGIRRFLSDPRKLRAFNLAMGLSLLALALNLLS